ncbi:choice-of-anchor B family protein [Thalassotalea crassostreae]|uniref:choice-of-anchor B family protein n=1 Tax=Thalassotalea crassostreae TaxID=1763536 RepID=UPI0008385598|nr:choice-of-anchor B family protein [Thalassotalea crassostreae]
MNIVFKILTINLLLIASIYSTGTFAHAEHDKARYVAASGVDSGRCDNPKKPCKTIDYAAKNANKGDQIRLAIGSYNVETADTLFYLLSDLVPVKPNFELSNSFATPYENSKTYLTGVPSEYAQQLNEKGFTIIADSKGAEINKNRTEIKAKLAAYARLKQKKNNISCTNNYAGDHPCKNIDLLAHIPLSSFSTNPAEANDIWGHFDLNDQREYAIIGLSNGIGFVDISKPSEPRVVDTIASQQTIWRDIKVYQFFDAQLNRWRSYAYITADNASVGLLIVDLSGLPETVSVIAQDKTDLSAHNIYLSNVDYSTGVSITNMKPYLHIAGSDKDGGGFNTYSLEDPENLVSVYKPSPNRNQYSHDVSSMTIEDQRKDSQCVNGTDHCEVMFDFNENDFQLWDKTENSSPEKLSTTSYQNASYVHSGWYTEDKMLMLVHDELDEQEKGLNTTLRLFDITDLTKPNLLSTWTGTSRAIDHNGYVRGNRYYMSNYERGVTVLDISDPTLPREIGFFDTYPISDKSAFHGAWGVYPFLPSGNIIVSDINSGLYVLQDNTLDSEQGSFAFDARNYNSAEGDSFDVMVSRTNVGNDENLATTEVYWELVTGSAGVDDFVLSKGKLIWQGSDTSNKAINVQINNDDVKENTETLFIRLYDPQNGATLAQPNLAMINIAGSNGNSIPVVNAGDNFEVTDVGDVSLLATATDADNEQLTYLWQQISGSIVELNNSDSLNATFVGPSVNETLTFRFTATDSSGLSASDDVSVTINYEIITVTPNGDDSSSGTLYLLLSCLGFSIIVRNLKKRL